MVLKKNSTITLNNNVEMPIIGLGTWTLSGKDAYQSTLWALDLDYRLIDTATIYGNEKQVGKAIKDSGIDRNEIFITTKVWDTEQGHDSTLKAFETSLKKLQLDHVDLYLIHWPARKRLETWEALEKLYEDGKARAIGVSNFTIRHLEELLENSTIPPVLNQVEFSPFLYQKNLMDFCRSKGIHMEAYASLTRTKKFNDPSIKSLSEKYGKSPAQIMIRWGLKHQIIQIPKSSTKFHLQENIDVFNFKFSKEDLDILDALNEDFRTVTDPNIYD